MGRLIVIDSDAVSHGVLATIFTPQYPLVITVEGVDIEEYLLMQLQ